MARQLLCYSYHLRAAITTMATAYNYWDSSLQLLGLPLVTSTTAAADVQ
jgi:hypothetical protein